jgi:S-adenosylmethionine-dependent methyltransferase
MDLTPPEGSLHSPSGGDPERHRPLERRAAARTAVVWDAVRRLLDAPGSHDEDRARIVDIGGGTGGFAVRLAELGHRVTVVDPSPDALAALARRADESDVADLVTGVQGDLAGLPDVVTTEADLVLCHGVLGILDDPAAGLATIGGVLRPGGTLSLLVGQRHAAVLAKAMAGHFRQARAALDATDGAGEHRFTATEVTDLLAASGFTPQAVQAVRVFSDLVPGSLLDLEPGSSAALLDLERAVADRPEYLTLAAQLHVLATH